MAGVDVNVTVRASGPIYDGSAPGIVHAWLDGVKRDIAEEGVKDLRSFAMDKTGRATGAYQRAIGARGTLTGYNDVVIFAAYPPAVYGPWLEGFSQRNRSTRFKGYRLWRLTRQRLQEKAPGSAEQRLPELARRLGGG